MADQLLYHAVRHHLEHGRSLSETRAMLATQGYPLLDIQAATHEYFTHERENHDGRLVHEIEARLSRHEPLQHIFAALADDGHRPFEVAKALMHAKVNGSKDLKSAMRSWHRYSLMQLAILITTILLALFYDAFVIATIAILFEMAVASFVMPKKHKAWRKEVTILPFGDIWVNDEILGYNGHVGNYWRYRLLEPATVLSCFFLLFGMSLYHTHGSGFLVSCLVLSVLSFLAFWIHLPYTAEPLADG